MEELIAPCRVLLFLALTLFLPPVALAQKAPPKAKLEEATRHFQRGKELYEASDFAGSLSEFQRAYELLPSYKLLYNIGQVSFQLKDYASALRSFNRYLAEGQAEIPAARREEVQRDIDSLRTRVATLRISTDKPGAEIAVDDVPVGHTPMVDPVLVNAGRRRITATLAGFPTASRVVEVAGLEVLRLNLELSPQVAPPQPVASAVNPAPSLTAPAPKPAGKPLLWIPWTVTGGLAVAAGVTGALANNASNDLKAELQKYPGSRAAIDEAAARTRSLALTTDIMGGLAVVAAGVSLAVTFSGGGEPPKRASRRLDVGIGPGGLAVAGTF